MVWLMVMTRALFARKHDATEALIGSTLAVLVTMTCVYDAAVLGRPWAFGVRLPFLIVWPVATPLYVIRSRGWRGCVMLLIHVSLLIAIVVPFAIIAGLMQVVGR